MESAPAGTVAEQGITPAELRLAARNHAMPLEALRYDLTPAGLHYLLIHYDIPSVDAESFRLEVGGAVERPMTVSLGELREREGVAEPITFECAGNGRALLEPRPVSQPWLTEAVGTAEWGGTLLAHDMNGAPLPPQHGFPLRLVVPGWYGMQNVKWLTRITVLEEPYTGFQNAVAYRMYGIDGEPGEPVTRMLPRSLTVPPGVPDFMTRTRHLAPGRTTLSGKAWSGQGPIASVQVSTDGGETWAEADLGAELGPHAWRGWTHDWDAPVGAHVISSRATDAAGNTQPLEPPWNLKGYANNEVEQIPVTVAPPS